MYRETSEQQPHWGGAAGLLIIHCREVIPISEVNTTWLVATPPPPSSLRCRFHAEGCILQEADSESIDQNMGKNQLSNKLQDFDLILTVNAYGFGIFFLLTEVV
jgi:hypothetical protein